ncbi:beta-ketoacyl synthase N-terminal-like domain-containing protein [Streptomyces sp. NPDC052496]|uniref:beta-ketoacyl synthase N-terminal-like domain-containing protein n=1 Tax=Streptomyces sp. NPDC052496 TaxID=3154951 RepID=UPI00343976B2
MCGRPTLKPLARPTARTLRSLRSDSPASFPGPAPRAFWNLLREGVDAIGETPRDRWDAEAWYDADPGAPGRTPTRRGGYLARWAGSRTQFAHAARAVANFGTGAGR